MTHFIYAETGHRVAKGDRFKTGPDGLAQVAAFDFDVARDSGVLIEYVEKPWESISRDKHNPTEGYLNGVLGVYCIDGERVEYHSVMSLGTVWQTACFIEQVESFKEVATFGEGEAVMSAELASDIYDYFMQEDVGDFSSLQDRIREELS